MINKKENKINKTIKFTEKINDDIFYIRVENFGDKDTISIIAAERLSFGEINGGNYAEKYAGKLPGCARTEISNLSFYKTVIQHLVDGYPEKTFYFSGTDSRRNACYTRLFKKMGIELKPWGNGFTFSGK